MVAVVAQPVSTEKKKLGYTFENQGCSGCSTSFNHSWISPKLYLRKSGLQWLLNWFEPFLDLYQTIPSEIRVAVVAQPVSTEKKIGVYLRKSWLQWLLNQFQPKKKNWGIPSEIRVAVVAQPVSTKKKLGYTFKNQGCSGISTSFNHSWISPKLYLRK